jgi:hypothetical protein
MVFGEIAAAEIGILKPNPVSGTMDHFYHLGLILIHL